MLQAQRGAFHGVKGSQTVPFVTGTTSRHLVSHVDRFAFQLTGVIYLLSSLSPTASVPPENRQQVTTDVCPTSIFSFFWENEVRHMAGLLTQERLFNVPLSYRNDVPLSYIHTLSQRKPSSGSLKIDKCYLCYSTLPLTLPPTHDYYPLCSHLTAFSAPTSNCRNQAKARRHEDIRRMYCFTSLGDNWLDGIAL